MMENNMADKTFSCNGAPTRNIILIGMMGVGKTAVGRTLARDLNYDFYDTDTELEHVTDLKMSDILKKYGAIRFHSEEALLIKKLAGVDHTVISTGIDAALSPENVAVLKNLGLVVWLRATPQTIFQRIKRKSNRPFIPKGATVDDIAALLAQREEYYRLAADLEVKVDGNDLDFVVKEIKKQLKIPFSCIK